MGNSKRCINLPLISVIIPVYRVEKYLRQCVNSVISQTYTNLEIILVDDGSPDGSGKICDEYIIRDKRVRVIHQANQGLSAARNAGLEIAKGDFIGFVDSDDYIEPDMYKYLYDLIVKNKAAISMCNVCEDEGFRTRKQIQSTFLSIPLLQIFQFNNWIFVWNKLYRKDFISTLRFNTTTSYGEDGLFVFELTKKNASVSVGNQAKYHYRFNQNPNALTNNFQPKHLNRIALIEQCLQYAKQHNISTYYQQRSSIPLLNVTKWLKQIACSPVEDPASVQFLTNYIKKHFRRFLSIRGISYRAKLFVLVACVNFNLARKILRFYCFKIKKQR